MLGNPKLSMSSKVMKKIGWFFLLISLAAVFFHLLRLPHRAAVVVNAAAPAVTFQGGAGGSPDTAVIIRGAADNVAGVAAEYRYLREKFGKQHQDWRLQRQALLQQAGKVFDVMHLELANGSQQTIYFDITDFFGKM